MVKHRRYHYRAVILAADPRCKASRKWYEKNLTQPDRNQPWYSVIDEHGLERYVAEENLDLDRSGRGIDHPLVQLHFPTFLHGRYYRQSMN